MNRVFVFIFPFKANIQKKIYITIIIITVINKISIKHWLYVNFISNVLNLFKFKHATMESNIEDVIRLTI